MRKTFVVPEKVNEADLVCCHRTKGRGCSWRRPVGGYRRFEAVHQFRGERSREVDRSVVLRASPLQLCRACLGVVAQTTTPEWPAPKFCLELFSFDGAKGMEHQLDDAVVLEGGQRDQLGGCCYANPESWMLDEVHGK